MKYILVSQVFEDRNTTPLPKITIVPLETFYSQSFFYDTLMVHLLP
jgi:hypothetical protein